MINKTDILDLCSSIYLYLYCIKNKLLNTKFYDVEKMFGGLYTSKLNNMIIFCYFLYTCTSLKFY